MSLLFKESLCVTAISIHSLANGLAAQVICNPGDLFITSYQLNQLTFPEVPIVDVLLELHPLEGEGRGALVLQPVPPSGGQRCLNTGGGE